MFKNLKVIFTNSTLVSSFKNYSKYNPHDGHQMLRVELRPPIITILQGVRPGDKVNTLLLHVNNYPPYFTLL
jgi:hypothetical protein